MDEGEGLGGGATDGGISDRSQVSSQLTEKAKYMLWTIAVILILLWALGLSTHVAGSQMRVVAIVVGTDSHTFGRSHHCDWGQLSPRPNMMTG
jgi:Family of unknown function (DUF5670)